MMDTARRMGCSLRYAEGFTSPAVAVATVEKLAEMIQAETNPVVKDMFVDRLEIALSVQSVLCRAGVAASRGLEA